jgi:hypothetical protein
MQARVCDVYRTANKVARYRVTVARLDDDGEVAAKDNREGDLCERALVRLQHKIKTGFQPPISKPMPPRKKKKKGAEASEKPPQPIVEPSSVT